MATESNNRSKPSKPTEQNSGSWQNTMRLLTDFVVLMTLTSIALSNHNYIPYALTGGIVYTLLIVLERGAANR